MGAGCPCREDMKDPSQTNLGPCLSNVSLGTLPTAGKLPILEFGAEFQALPKLESLLHCFWDLSISTFGGLVHSRLWGHA